MATTNKIKVNNVRVGDPNLTVTLASDDGGTFPRYVQLTATITNSNLTNGSLQVTGKTGPNNAPTSITIQCSFPDSAYESGQTFGYDITNVSFSDDGSTWTSFSGTYATDGQPWDSSITSQDFLATDILVSKPASSQDDNNVSFWGKIIQFFRRLFGFKML